MGGPPPNFRRNTPFWYVFWTSQKSGSSYKAELSNVEGSATPLRLRTIAIGLLAIYGSRGNAPTVKNYALPSDLEAKSLECDDYA